MVGTEAQEGEGLPECDPQRWGTRCLALTRRRARSGSASAVTAGVWGEVVTGVHSGRLQTLWGVVRNLKLDSKALRHPGGSDGVAKRLAGFSVAGGAPVRRVSLRVSSWRRWPLPRRRFRCEARCLALDARCGGHAGLGAPPDSWLSDFFPLHQSGPLRMMCPTWG